MLKQAGSVAGSVVESDGITPANAIQIQVNASYGRPFTGCSVAAAQQMRDAMASHPDLRSAMVDPWHPGSQAGIPGRHGTFPTSDTDQLGNFAIVRLPEGEYRISASSRTHHSATVRVNVANGQCTRGLRLVLSERTKGSPGATL